MNGGEEPAGLNGPLGLPPARSVLPLLTLLRDHSRRPFPAALCQVGLASLGGAGRPDTRPKFFENFL